MSDQNEIMTEQNKTMSKQAELARGQLEQAQRATQQTQIIIERTAMEQRAWLSAGFPHLKNDSGPTTEIKAGVQITAVTTVHNSGKTPAYVVGSTGALKVLDNDALIPSIIQAAVVTAANEGRVNTIASNQGINSHFPRETLSEV